jgi:hypothetical protein
MASARGQAARPSVAFLHGSTEHVPGVQAQSFFGVGPDLAMSGRCAGRVNGIVALDGMALSRRCAGEREGLAPQGTVRPLRPPSATCP